MFECKICGGMLSHSLVGSCIHCGDPKPKKTITMRIREAINYTHYIDTVSEEDYVMLSDEEQREYREHHDTYVRISRELATYPTMYPKEYKIERERKDQEIMQERERKEQELNERKEQEHNDRIENLRSLGSVILFIGVAIGIVIVFTHIGHLIS